MNSIRGIRFPRTPTRIRSSRLRGTEVVHLCVYIGPDGRSFHPSREDRSLFWILGDCRPDMKTFEVGRNEADTHIGYSLMAQWESNMRFLEGKLRKHVKPRTTAVRPDVLLFVVRPFGQRRRFESVRTSFDPSSKRIVFSQRSRLQIHSAKQKTHKNDNFNSRLGISRYMDRMKYRRQMGCPSPT